MKALLRFSFAVALLSYGLLISCVDKPEEKPEPPAPVQPSVTLLSSDINVDKAVVTLDVKDASMLMYKFDPKSSQSEDWQEMSINGDGQQVLEFSLEIEEPGVYEYVFEAYATKDDLKSEILKKELSFTKEREVFELKGGVANSYIISPVKYNRFTFSPAVRVNQFWADAANGGVVGDHPSTSGNGDGFTALGSADNAIKESDEWYLEVIWADIQDYSKFVFAQTQETPGKGNQEAVIDFDDVVEEGNIVIGLKKVGGENYLWSWHLWITSYDPEDEGRTKVILPEVFEGGYQDDFFNNGREIMDRNLGATANEAGSAKSFGLLYQWGRKDPFPGATSFESTEIKFKYPVEEGMIIKSEGTVIATVYNPKAIYFSDDMFADEYLSGPFTGTDGVNRWGGCEAQNNPWPKDNEKTIYDPCPEGWKVPAGIYWLGILATWESEIKGYEYESNYIPATGFIDGNSKQLLLVGQTGYYWSASSFGSFTDSACKSIVDPQFVGSVAYSAYGSPKQNGFSVRPIREK